MEEEVKLGLRSRMTRPRDELQQGEGGKTVAAKDVGVISRLSLTSPYEVIAPAV